MVLFVKCWLAVALALAGFLGLVWCFVWALTHWPLALTLGGLMILGITAVAMIIYGEVSA